MTKAKDLTTAREFTDRDRTRFWAKVNVPAGNQDATPATCWEWTASLTPGGYGRFKLNGRQVIATRAAYAMHYGEVPVDKEVCHMCDNPKCVRRTHLYLGTPAENMQDRESAGHTRRGEDHWNAALTAAMVNTARRRAAMGDSITDLAAEFGVSRKSLWNAVTGDRGAWAEATEPPVDVAAVTERKRAARLDQARALIAGGSTITAAAREVGVCRRTLYVWFKDDAPAAV